MSDDLLQRLRTATKGVTEGPWEAMLGTHGRNKICASYLCINGLSALFTIADINVPDDAERGYTDDAFNPEVAAANTYFIAAARTLIPEAAAEIARLQARIAELEGRNE